MYRTHTCGQLRAANVNETVTLAGWVQKVRNLGAMTFIDLRDRYGITQIVVEEHSPADVKAVAGGLGREYVLQVEGRVVERSSKNPKMPTGDIEVVASKLVVLHEAEVPPFTIEENSDGGDDLRMKYRYLDLRRPPLQRNMILRHIFADYSATVIHNYESTTGETLPEEFKDGYSNGYDDAWYETYGDLLDKVEEVNATNWEDKYYNVLNEQGGGIVYVNTDGSYDYYADYDAFAAAHPEAVGDSLESYVGQDLNLEKVLCTFGVDDQGRLTDNHIEVTFQTTEKDGSSHTLVLTGDVTLTNYGTTTIQPLDVGDRTLITY